MPSFIILYCNPESVSITPGFSDLFFDKNVFENQINDLKKFKEIIEGDNKNPSEVATNKILEYLKN